MSTGHDDPGDPDEGLTADEAFALVGNDVRAEILRALSQARGGQGVLESLSFSELYSRVDVDVTSSQFNYHLQELLGTFVERGEERNAQLDERMAGDLDEGYVLRPEGTILTRTIRSQVVSGSHSLEPFDTGFECHFCGTSVEAVYGNAVFMARCPGCDYMYEYDLTPPGGVDDDEEVLLEQVGRYLWHRRLTFADGVCPMCSNGLRTSFVVGGETVYPRSDRREVMINRWCDHCGERSYLRTGELLLREPALVAFCENNGIDAGAAKMWELEFASTDRYVSVESTDPWRVSFHLPAESEEFHVELDEDLSVSYR